MKIIQKLINNLKDYISYLKSFFQFKKLVPVSKTQSDSTTPDSTTPFELRQVFSEIRIDYDTDIKEPPNFNKEDDFHILLIDDNRGALALLEMDIDTILGNNRTITVGPDLEEDLVSFKEIILNHNITFEVQKIGGDYAPFSIYKKLMNSYDYRIDFAVIDIIYGTIVYDKDKPLKIDGIDLAKKIKEINPNAEIILFTGSNLTPLSVEYKKIIEFFDKDFMKTNLIFKTPDYNKRLIFFMKELKISIKKYLKFFKKQLAGGVEI